MRKELVQEDILDLPLHDSDFMGMAISRQNNGETNLSLKVILYPGEWENLPEDLLRCIQSDGAATFLFQNCWWIDLGVHGNRTQRDCLDFMQFLKDSPKLREYGGKTELKHVEVHFVSGSKLECVFERLALA